jgi:hypothetical protein
MQLLLSRDRFLGRAELASRHRSRLHLDKRDRPAVVSHQIDSSREAGADESDRPFRAAQSTNPNVARAKICTLSSFLPSWFSL